MTRESFLNRDRKINRSQRRAKKQEKQLAQRFKGSQIPGSGSSYQKGDVRVKGITRVEAKTTKHKSFSVTRDMIEKISDAGALHNEVPVMVVEFINEQGTPQDEVAVMPMWALELLIMRLGDQDGEKNENL